MGTEFRIHDLMGHCPTLIHKFHPVRYNVKSCALSNCKNTSDIVLLLSFPKKQELYERWVQAVPQNARSFMMIEYLDPEKASKRKDVKLCIDHFKQDDREKAMFYRGKNRPVPSQFTIPIPSNQQESTTSEMEDKEDGGYEETNSFGDWSDDEATYDNMESESDDENITDYECDSEPEEDGDIRRKNQFLRTFPPRSSCIEQVKVIVCLDALAELFNYCQKCGAKMTSISYCTTGSTLKVKFECVKGCSGIWQSMPNVSNDGRSKGLSDVLITSAMTVKGKGYKELEPLESINVLLPSRRTFFRIDNEFTYPAVNDVFTRHLENVKQEISDNEGCSGRTMALSSDACLDSPGFSANIAISTLMDSARITFDDSGTAIGSTPGTGKVLGYALTHYE